jgi:triacylglycerol lipase
MASVRSLSPRRRALVIGVASAIVAAIAVVATIRLLGDPEQGGIPVIVVPGYGGDPRSVATLVEALRAREMRVEALDLPEDGTGDIARSAQALEDAVVGLGANRIDLVGYSAGAIVVRQYLSALGGSDTARRVVLLGAPNHGAEAAELAASFDPSACVGACAQLGPGSSFLARLNSGDETPGDALYVSIWTSRDQTVTPPDSALLEGAVNVRVQDVCPGANTSHGELVTDPLVLSIVVDALRGNLDEQPAVRECAAG